MKLTFGADPELFVRKGGQYVSAFNLIPGTKVDPMPVQAGAVQVDGMALEFNINPSQNWQAFRNNVDTVMTELRKLVPGDYDFDMASVADFDQKYLESLPREARELGCNPDFNAWTMEENPPPNAKVNFRTAAGHVHIGWTKDVDPLSEEHFISCVELVKQLDCILGLTSVMQDKEKRRRELYGKAGAFRPKPYGVEYRVLSNYWLFDNGVSKNMLENTQRAADDLERGVKYVDVLGDEFNVPEIINTSDENKAWTALDVLFSKLARMNNRRG